MNNVQLDGDLSLSYNQLMSLDDVTVDTLPEKKGMIMKHTEYLIRSTNYNSSSQRRYTDFEVFYDLLVMRYPYRMVPRLPPKKIGMTDHFINERRKALARFLSIISRHPVLRKDPIVQFFFTVEVHDFHIHLKDKFKNCLDEFVTNPDKDKIEEQLNVVSGDVNGMKTELANMLQSVTVLRDLSERWVNRTKAAAYDLQMYSNELSVLAGEGQTVSAWSSHKGDAWSKLREGMRGLSAQFSNLSERVGRQRIEEDAGILENIALLLDILQGVKDLVDRREKGVNKEHQQAFSRVQQLKKQKGSIAASGQGTGAGIQEKIEQQESLINNIGLRNNFSVLCLHWEMKQLYTYLSHFGVIWNSFVKTQLSAHNDLCSLWQGTGKFTSLMTSAQSSAPISYQSAQPSAPAPSYGGPSFYDM